MEKKYRERMRKRGFSLLLFFLLLPIEIVYTIATRASGIPVIVLVFVSIIKGILAFGKVYLRTIEGLKFITTGLPMNELQG